MAPVAAALAGVAAALLALAAATVATARPPRRPVPDVDTYLARWSALHGGYDPGASRAASAWLRLARETARSSCST